MLALHPLVAQRLPSRNLGLQQGLPEYYVSGIVQDKAGFVWIATRDGLARYDGRRFKLFRHQSRNPRSLSNNVITSLQLVSDSALLVQLETGTSQVFNPQTEQFKDLLTRQRLDQDRIQVSRAILTADERQFWGRHERQLMRYSPRQNQITHYSLPDQFLPDKIFAGNHLLLDSLQHRIYAPYPGGMAELDIRTGQFRAWPFSSLGQPGAVQTYYGIPLARRANGELLTVAPGRLVTFSTRTHRFRTIPIPDKLSTTAGVLHGAFDGNTYFTYGMSVYRLTPDDRITLLWTAPRIDYRNYFHALLLDRSGVLWVGTNGDGVQQIDLSALPTRTYPYQVNYLVDLLAIELGFSVPDYIKANEMAYSLRWSKGMRYLAGWMDGLYYRLLRADSTQHQFGRLSAIHAQYHPDGNGLKMITPGGLWLYVPFKGILNVDTTGRLLAEWPLLLEGVTDIQPAGPLVWVGTEFNGVYAYDLRQKRIVRHLRYQAGDATSLISDQVWCLAADPQDPAVLWIGTQEGLSRLDTRTMRCRNWTEQQGLPNATINCLLTDARGRLWFSTLQGISRLDPRTGRMRHFTTDDGLLDIEYRREHGAQLSNGRLAFGGATGMTLFDPLALEDSPRPIPVALTALRIGNVPVEPRPAGSPLTRSLNATSTLSLNYSQNFLNFEFAGLQYNKPTTLQYRYQLTGVDADWVYVGNQTVANYTQLAPGTYEFRVNAADALGNWSRFVKTIRVQIAPPWWRTGWFYGLVIMASLSGMYGIYRYRLAQVLKLQHLRNDIARDLHDEVGSSISSIAIYSKIVLEQVGASTFKSEPLLVKITEQANDIMGSMNDIVWSINTQNDAFDKVFIRMREHAFQLLEAKGYTLHFEFDEHLHRTRLGLEKRRDVYLIYKEALNNIAKYANGQNVWISVHLRNASIDLLIRDDGQGFEMNAVGSQGNGLPNMNYRARALNGTLRIDSEPGTGTTLHLRF